MSPDQTAHSGEVLSGSILFTIIPTKVNKQMRQQTTIVANGEKMVNKLHVTAVFCFFCY